MPERQPSQQPSAPDETERLAALTGFGVLGTGPDAALDGLARLAARFCDAPVALVTLVDDARQLVVASEGHAGPAGAPLDVGFCPTVVERAAALVIPDTHPAHAADPAVSGDGIRFYAGVPLRTEEGHVLGTLCVLDRVPRPGGLTASQLQALETLAAQVTTRFELRRSLARQAALVAEQRAVSRERDAFSRVQAAVAAAGGELDVILDALVAGALEAVPAADAGVLELIDGDALEYRAVGGALLPHKGLRVPLQGSLAGHCALTGSALLVDDELRDPRLSNAMIRAIAQRAALFAPVMRGERVLGVVKLQSSRPGAFTPRDLQLLRLFAGAATAGLTEVRAVEAQRALDAAAQRQRAIFNSATQFAMVVTDRDGRITDWNSGAERILGWSAPEMLGRTVERIFTPEDRAGGRADIEMRLAAEQGRAANERWHLRKDGARFWASGEMMPLRDGSGAHVGYVKVLRDRTDEHLAGVALREDKRRRDALLGLNDRWAELDEEAASLTDVACDILGRTLGVQLVGYGLVDPDAETITVERDWTTGGASSLAGTLHFRDFGSYVDELKRGETVVVTDARADPRTRAFAEALEARSARAFVNVPVLEHGRFVALLYVSTGEKRDWTEGELLFVREVAGRTRTATARREAERALRASEGELRQVADALPFLVSFVDRTLTYQFANAAYAWWVGRAPEEVVGLTMRDIAGEEFFALRRPAVERALAGTPAQLDVDWPWPDGRRRVADVRYLPRKTLNGAVDGFYITVQDVTALRDATALLAERADTLAREVDARTVDLDRAWRLAQELLVIVLPDGTLEAVNPLWTELLGWTEQELAGSKFIDYTHPDDLAATLDAFAGVFDRPLTSPYAYRFRHKDGSYRWFSWTAAFEDGRVYASGRDVTLEREQAEALRQSQKMEAVGQLTGGLAHDFNNLLAGISGALELMGIRVSQGRIKDVERYMVAAQGAARRAAALTHRLLAFSRRQTLAPKPTDVNALVTGMLELIQRTVGPGIHVDVVTVAGLWPALVDAPQLENALLNLCINARDAMPGGGRITVETANRWIDRHGARHHDVPEGQYLSLCVSDTGTGMSPEVVAKAFDPFFTTKPQGEGTGLGLSMIYGFARQSGGQARIYTELGQGTMVCIYLPRHTGEAEADASGPEPGARPVAEAGETVLVVDDEPTVRLLVTDVLEDLGYTAIEAADSVAGLKVLQSDVRIDLLVTDIGLPGGMNGRQMVDAGRAGRPNLKVLFITGYAENALLNNGQLAPGMSVLTKPFAVDTLAARMRELIAT